jgi:hypothetical protein
LIDTDGVAVVELLMLLLLPLCVEDAGFVLVLVLVLLLRAWDTGEDSGVFVEIELADVGNDDADTSEVVLFGDGDGDEDGDEAGVEDGDGDDEASEACADVEDASEVCVDVEDAAESRLDDVGIALGVSVTVLTDTAVAVADESVTVLYTIWETVVGASDSTTVETTVVCAAAVLVGAEPPSTLTTA